MITYLIFPYQLYVGGDLLIALMQSTRRLGWSCGAMRWPLEHGQIGWNFKLIEKGQDCSSWASLRLTKSTTKWLYCLFVHINLCFCTNNERLILFVTCSGTDWGTGNDQNCYGETEPISRREYWGSESDRKMMEIAENSVNGLKRKGLDIQYLNVTQLAEYRKDAHPSVYKRNWVAPTKEQLSSPRKNSDCVHWCLPGVPDVWNQILYAHILDSSRELYK